VKHSVVCCLTTVILYHGFSVLSILYSKFFHKNSRAAAPECSSPRLMFLYVLQSKFSLTCSISFRKRYPSDSFSDTAPHPALACVSASSSPRYGDTANTNRNACGRSS